MIDVSEGDRENLNTRCRLVGKEFQSGPDDALDASTPPLEALRVKLSCAATVDAGGEEKGTDGKRRLSSVVVC